MRASGTGWACALALAGSLPGCVRPECVDFDYRDPECRVIADNELARLHLQDGVELRFQPPFARNDGAWDARGVFTLLETGQVQARVAGAGPFAITLASDRATQVELVLDNVDPRAVVELEDETGVHTLAAGSRLRRVAAVDLAPGRVQWIRGTTACPERYRVAMVGDIQTNPPQFRRIIEHLQASAEDDEVPLMALVVVGDLSEHAYDEEFVRLASIFALSPVPVAVTAGNHDVYEPAQPFFHERMGPSTHAFTICDSRFVLLDSGSGTIARSVEARLPELLARDGARDLVIGVHHPPYAGLTGAGWSREDHAQILLVEAAIAEVDLIVAGHNHALREFSDIAVGDTRLQEIVVGTGGAEQGVAIPRFGYLQITFGEEGLDRCFVEVPPPGWKGPRNEPLPGLRYCEDPA